MWPGSIKSRNVFNDFANCLVFSVVMFLATYAEGVLADM